MSCFAFREANRPSTKRCGGTFLPNPCTTTRRQHYALDSGNAAGVIVNFTNRPAGALSASTAASRDAERTTGLVINRISAQKPRREITLEVGRRDIRIRRSYRLTGKSRLGGGMRSNVTKFTNASKRRLMFTARNFPGLEIMLTLTYPADFPLDGRIVKNHWRRFRQWMVRNGAKTGLWVLEFQKRGAPHFHIFIQEPLDKDAVANAWYRIVGSGDPKHLEAGTRIETFRPPPCPRQLRHEVRRENRTERRTCGV